MLDTPIHSLSVHRSRCTARATWRKTRNRVSKKKDSGDELWKPRYQSSKKNTSEGKELDVPADLGGMIGTSVYKHEAMFEADDDTEIFACVDLPSQEESERAERPQALLVRSHTNKRSVGKAVDEDPGGCHHAACQTRD